MIENLFFFKWPFGTGAAQAAEQPGLEVLSCYCSALFNA
jgi:hypothetical protein